MQLKEHHKTETEYLLSLIPNDIKRANSIFVDEETKPFDYDTQKVWKDGW